jgi:hypothetical protein
LTHTANCTSVFLSEQSEDIIGLTRSPVLCCAVLCCIVLRCAALVGCRYFDTGVSSVYFFTTDKDEKDSKNFGACFLIHKGNRRNAASPLFSRPRST